MKKSESSTSKVRMIKKGIILQPKENFDEDQPNLNEILEGVGGKGQLARKYIDTLDIEFHAFRSKESKNDHSPVVSVRLPDSLLSDIAQMVESKKTPYLTKSEFIRSAVFILTNYWAHKYQKLGKRYTIQMGIEECGKVRRDHESMARYTQAFKEALPFKLQMTDKEVDIFLREQERIIKTQYDENHRYALMRQFEGILIENGVESGSYFQIKDKDKEEESE